MPIRRRVENVRELTSEHRPTVIVLAAGAGTRMKSTTPKVLHDVCGRSLVGHVLHAASAVEPERLVVVVRHQRDLVAAHITDVAPHAIIADQDEIPGTGRAVWCGLQALPDDLEGPVIVTAADTPLLDGDTLVALLAAHEGNDITVLTTLLPDATGYGRVIRDENGIISSIVEHRDATEEQLAIREINSSMYVFDAALLRSMLGGLDTDNAQGEMYLTDVISNGYKQGLKVGSYIGDPLCVEGVNDRVQLAALTAIMNRRLLEKAMRAGTTVEDPSSTWVEVGVTFEQDTLVRPGSYLTGTTSLASGAAVGPHVYLDSVTVGPGVDAAFGSYSHTSLTIDTKDGQS